MNEDKYDGALFDKSRKYRYVLWRLWDINKPNIMFIGLNPSTANEDSDDPTIRRVISFAKKWGYGGVYMLNLFTFITTCPEELMKCDDPIGPVDIYLTKYAQKCDKIIFAWGNFKIADKRGKEIMNMFTGYVLLKNKNGSPRHPLYVSGDVIPVVFNN